MGWGGLENGDICVAASAKKRSTFLIDDIERKWICSGTQSHSVFCYQYSINWREKRIDVLIHILTYEHILTFL